MIRLTPRPPCPPHLSKVGADRIQVIRKFLSENLPVYLADEAKLKFPDDYRHPEVKSALVSWQRGKCAFCEARIGATQHGDVEHLRPKGGWIDEATGSLVRPGYWWLAFTWENLFLSCQICNQSFKANRFPISGTRVTDEQTDLSVEVPLLLDPSVDEPAAHLSFDREVAVGASARGSVTIDVLGLNRQPAVEDRRAALDLIRALVGVWPFLPAGHPEQATVEDVLRASTRADHPFTAMVRSVVPEALHDRSLDPP